MKWGCEIFDSYDLFSLWLLGLVGELINFEVWCWYCDVIGGGCILLVDIWWQIEIGFVMIFLLFGIVVVKLGLVMMLLFGILVKIVDDYGDLLLLYIEGVQYVIGYFVLDQLWLLMLCGIWGDFVWYWYFYWFKFFDKGYYFVGDGVCIDFDGVIWVLGCIDDVMNVFGYWILIVEVELVLVVYFGVVEVVVVGVIDEIMIQVICVFVVLCVNYVFYDCIVEELCIEVV